MKQEPELMPVKRRFEAARRGGIHYRIASSEILDSRSSLNTTHPMQTAFGMLGIGRWSKR
jgi:hypothetical protein